MKIKYTALTLSVSALFASSAFAADYICTVKVSQGPKVVATLSPGQGATGLTQGTLASVNLQTRKNIFGRATKTVDVEVSGYMENDIQDSVVPVYLVNAKVTLETNRSVVGKPTLSTTLATISGTGNFDIPEQTTDGYTINGKCESVR